MQHKCDILDNDIPIDATNNLIKYFKVNDKIIIPQIMILVNISISYVCLR